jgi:hypothetical protein
MRDPARHHANFATTNPENFTRALEVCGAADLNKQLRSGVKETTSLALKKHGLLGDADLQLPGPKRRERPFEISRNRQHKVGFLLLIADKCNLSPLPWGENLR